jgi:hypothetical protein
MDEITGVLGLSLGFLSVVGGLGVAFYAMWLKSKRRQMRHEEHMAMIEKGLVPPQAADVHAGGGYQSFRKQRETGIMLICIGIALMMFFGLSTGNWRSVWMGGFVLMFGVANLTIALLNERDRRARETQPSRTGETL